jgi:eukaryotic translation initiation factor 2C
MHVYPGADVSHPSPGSDAPSIAALVFNTGPDTCMDYSATVRVQHARSEIIEDLVEMLQVHRPITPLEYDVTHFP